MSVDEALQRFGPATRFNAMLAAGLTAAGLLLFLVIRSLFGGSPFPDGSDGEWVAPSIVIDDVVVDIDLTMSIDDGEGSYGGTCNRFSVTRSETFSTAKGCDGDVAGYGLMEIDGRLLAAIESGGELIDSGDRLRFDHDGVTVELVRPDP